MRIGELPESMEKYRQLLEFQFEMIKICEERNAKRKSEKAKEEKKRWKAKRQLEKVIKQNKKSKVIIDAEPNC
jgi:hypothetical protein